MGVLVGSGVGVAVSVGVGVSVGRGVSVGIGVAVKVGLGVLVGVAEGSLRASGPPLQATTPTTNSAITAMTVTARMIIRFLVSLIIPPYLIPGEPT